MLALLYTRSPRAPKSARNAPGERVTPGVFAAKGVYDWMERTPGRNWINTGYGANVQSVDFGSPSGGRGKPVKMFVQPFSSPPVIGMRSGAYNGGYPMCIVYPQGWWSRSLHKRHAIPGLSLSLRRGRHSAKVAIGGRKSAASGCCAWELGLVLPGPVSRLRRSGVPGCCGGFNGRRRSPCGWRRGSQAATGEPGSKGILGTGGRCWLGLFWEDGWELNGFLVSLGRI